MAWDYESWVRRDVYGYNADEKTALKPNYGCSVGRRSDRKGTVRPAPSIYGGTDQVQRNIIGERVLGLPKDMETIG